MSAAPTGTALFSAESEATSGGTPLVVYEPDRSGTLTLSENHISAGQTGVTLPFTYTAGYGGMQYGRVSITVPEGWTAPGLSPTGPGYVTASRGTLSVSGQTITVSFVSLPENGTMTITYGDKSGGGTGTVSMAAPGRAVFSAQSTSTAGGTPCELATPPAVWVHADGSGTTTLPDMNIFAGQTELSLPFTYTAGYGGLYNGSVSIAVPAGWTAPGLTPTGPGYVTSSRGTVSVAGQTITVSGVTVSQGAKLTVTYGAKGSGGPGATAGPTAGSVTFYTSSKGTAEGTLLNLSTSPGVVVDQGSLSVAPGAAAGLGGTLHLRSTSSAAVRWNGVNYRLRSSPDWLHQAGSGPYENGTATIPWTVPATAGIWEIQASTVDGQGTPGLTQLLTVVAMDQPTGIQVIRDSTSAEARLEWTPLAGGTALKAGDLQSVLFVAQGPDGQQAVAATRGTDTWGIQWPAAWDPGDPWIVSVMALDAAGTWHLSHGEAVASIPAATVSVSPGGSLAPGDLFTLNLSSPSAVSWSGPEWRPAGGTTWYSMGGGGSVTPNVPFAVEGRAPDVGGPFQVRVKLADAAGTTGYTRPILISTPFVTGVLRTDGKVAVPTKVFNPKNWTVELTFLPQVIPSGGTERSLWSLTLDSLNSYALKVSANGRVHLVIRSNGVVTDTLVAADPVVEVGTANHILVRGDGGHVALFLNGVKSPAGTLVYEEPKGSLPLRMYFGGNIPVATGVRGPVAQIRIFGRALSDQEIVGSSTGSQDPTRFSVELNPGL